MRTLLQRGSFESLKCDAKQELIYHTTDYCIIILDRSILSHIIYLFLLLAVSHAPCFLKPSKVLNVKISSTSVVYAHYMFQPKLDIFICLSNCWINCCASVHTFNFWGTPSSTCPCVLWWWVVPLIVSCVAVIPKIELTHGSTAVSSAILDTWI
jgi:hypothetical protein